MSGEHVDCSKPLQLVWRYATFFIDPISISISLAVLDRDL